MRTIAFLVVCFNFLYSFELKPIKIAQNSYYFYGKEEYFSKENKGDISNSAFIITNSSVIVIDTGSSYEYGKAMIEAIKKITKKPIKYVINTHHHPDHFLGNNAFKNVDIYATQATADDISTNGELYIKNMNNLIGEAIRNTTIKAPNKILESKSLNFDGYELELLYFNGHTKSDLVIYDANTKVLYSADLVFNHRALATPHANLDQWIEALQALKTIDYKVFVPGHGLVFKDKKPIDQNIFYLQTLKKNLAFAKKNGLDTFEILELEVPKPIVEFSIFEEEYERSIINLYNKMEH